MKEHHLTVLKTARYYALGELGPDTQRLGFVCHGYKQLAGRFLQSFQSLDDGDNVVIAPEGLSRFYLKDSGGEHGPDAPIGASWMSREDRDNEIHDYVNYLDVLYARVVGDVNASNIPVFALGFSQGAATVSRWIALGVAPVDHLILWGGLLPPDLDLHTKQGEFKRLRVTYVVGESDPFIKTERVEAQQQKLAELKIASDVVRFDGGHEIDDGALAEVLRKES